jgi:putative membrane protein
MIALLVSWIIITVVILIVAFIVPGIKVKSPGSALLAAAVLGVLNVLVRPILVFLTLPITIITLGLFLLVINALILMLTSAIVPGFEVKSFWHAVLGAIVISIISFLTGTVLVL